MAREVSVVGLDIAKSVFQIHGADRQGRAVLHKRLRRGQICECFAQLKPCVVGIEATQGCGLLGAGSDGTWAQRASDLTALS
jgi:transposase